MPNHPAEMYPDPNNLPPNELLITAEALFNDKDFGGAHYYARFAFLVGQELRKSALETRVPSLNIAEQYLVRSSNVFWACRTEILSDLEKRLNKLTGITVTRKNLPVLHLEHSPHSIKMDELNKLYGKQYIMHCTQLS
ncbi:MAG: hypothetical protein KKG59_01000 [Nanoarchaeota archaeon]|nr:hypothetical protein [Nanoarchaeota archaeon]